MSRPAALLTYAVTPTAVPEGETVTLELAVANATGAYVPCQQIVFSLPVGTKPGALTNDPGAITPSPVAGTNWSISGDGAGNFTATPNAPVSGLGKETSIAFLLTGAPVNEAGGLAAIDVLETSGAPLAARSPQPPPAITKTKPGLAITSFTASPVAVCPGAQVTLAWTTTGAEHCVLSWPGASYTLEPQETGYPVDPEVATIYTLRAIGGGHHVQEDIPVAVLGPDIVSFAADPVDVGTLGGSSTLSWVVVNADSCLIKPAVGNVDPNAGTAVVTPSQPTPYFLEATGCGATVSAEAYVDIDPVQIASFTATPAVVPYGQQAELQWTTAAATGCSIDQGVGGVAANGSQPVTPSQPTTYTLTASGYVPKTATASVAIVPLITQITFTAEVAFGVPVVVLSWQTAGAAAVAIGGNPVNPSDSMQIDPTAGPWELVATAGAQTASVQLTTVVSSSMFEIFGGQVALSSAGGLNIPGQQIEVDWQADDDTYTGAVATGSGWSYDVPASQSGSLGFQVDAGGGVPWLWTGQLTASGGGDEQVTFGWTFAAETS